MGLCALVLIVILGLAGLAQLKFSSFLSDSIGERMEIVAATAAQDFGAAIDLGLSLDEVANGSKILERVRSHDPTISAIAVLDLGGQVLHSVGAIEANRIHAVTDAALRFAQSGISEAYWSVEADEQVRSGILIEGSFGQPVGAVVVHYPTTEMRQQEARMAGELLFDAARVGLALGAVVLLMVWFLHRQRADGSPAAPNQPSEPNQPDVPEEHLDSP
jgi:hypothetical protein